MKDITTSKVGYANN